MESNTLEVEIKTNKIQSELSKEVLDSFSREERSEILKYVEGVPLIRRMISPDRRYAKDMPKDQNDRIIPDLENPHILEDMDYFRKPALYYKEHGVYTKLYPNKHPNSEYRKFWKDEAQKCRDGCVRESDGEWIPGYYYYYLNYSPIRMVEQIAGRKARRWTDFPEVYDGDYFYFHYLEKARDAGMHGAILKRRGCGASFKGAAMLGRNLVLGENEYDPAVRAPTTSYAIANEKEYLIKDGILNKYISNVNWCAEKTPWPRIKVKDSMDDMTWRMGYKDRETGMEKGIGNEVMGVTLKNDPNKARGKRGQLIMWEESGKFRELMIAWNIARDSIEEGEFVIGLMLCWGTGGSEGMDFTALEEMFYNPMGYNIYPLNNVYDLNPGEGTKSSFFFGAYLNRKGFYDKNGNSDVIGATIAVIKDRIHVKNHTNDPSTVTQRKAENPMVPQEAVLRTGVSGFPVADIREQLAYIKTDFRRFVASHYTGELVVTPTGELEWRNKDLYPIREFPLVNLLDKSGAVEIYQMPIRSSDGKIPNFRYIAGIDPYDDDHSTTNSLGSIFIYDLFTERIVAEYTGRPSRANDFYETCRRLLTFYNATANYENDKKGLYGYFYNKGCLHLLCDNLQILEDKNLANIKENYGNKKKGTKALDSIHAWGRLLQADWLLEEAWGTGGEDDEGNEIPPKMNLQMIRSVAYLEEMSAWNPDGNFDRVDAMTMLMLYREDMKRLNMKGSSDNIKTKADDDFFNRHVRTVPKEVEQLLEF